mmetsp:Transcript_7190/g.10820  ORF Transcript_7190/g.10820 Transcript_7190/m.10820 type:complete len:228 (-) Transcript_7190:1981-2664(-)
MTVAPTNLISVGKIKSMIESKKTGMKLLMNINRALVSFSGSGLATVVVGLNTFVNAATIKPQKSTPTRSITSTINFLDWISELFSVALFHTMSRGSGAAFVTIQFAFPTRLLWMAVCFVSLSVNSTNATLLVTLLLAYLCPLNSSGANISCVIPLFFHACHVDSFNLRTVEVSSPFTVSSSSSFFCCISFLYRRKLVFIKLSEFFMDSTMLSYSDLASRFNLSISDL